MKRFRGGLVFKAHRWLYHSTLGSRVIKKKKKEQRLRPGRRRPRQHPPWMQPRGNFMVSLVNSHTNSTRIGWHLWEIDLRFAPGSPPGWVGAAGMSAGHKSGGVRTHWQLALAVEGCSCRGVHEKLLCGVEEGPARRLWPRRPLQPRSARKGGTGGPACAAAGEEKLLRGGRASGSRPLLPMRA